MSGDRWAGFSKMLVFTIRFYERKKKPSVFIMRDETGQMSDNVMLMVAIFDTPFHRFDELLGETL